MRASVIVCTWNRAPLLPTTVGSILSDSSRIDREVLVIDNGSSDNTREVIGELAKRSAISVRYLSEPRSGKSHALNRGVAEATGDILLFADDDVTVSDGWADALSEAFDEADVGIVGGRIVAEWPVDPPSWLSGLQTSALAAFDQGPESRTLTGRDTEKPTGANMAVRAALLRDIAEPFPASLGPQRGVKVDAEEWHLVDWTVARSYRIEYRSEAVAHHPVDEDRMNWEFVRRTFFQRGIGAGRSERLSGAEMASLPRRVFRVTRSYRGARQTRIRNARRDGPTAEQALQEFLSYHWFGWHLESLLGHYSKLTDWIAVHAV